MSQAHEYAQSHAEEFRNEFMELLRIPSISTDPQFAGEVRRAAEWIAQNMRSIGLEAELITMDEGRHPLVLGTWDGAGADAKTVLIYCHYDVQPAVVADGWDTDPFEPVEKAGQIFGRGATDSKVHVMAHMKALESLLKTAGKLPVNIKLLYEGEEESGSETINAFIEQHPERLKADVVLISDGIIRAPEQPSITYGLRGIATLELHVYGAQQDLHSGHFGGSIHNPAQAIAELIAQLHDEDGRVAVPGFYDDVLRLDVEERALLAQSNPLMEDEWQAVANPPKAWGEPDYNLHERIGARPTLEINGIYGGYAGAGFKTVLPAHALAKMSCRLVVNQDPARIATLVKGYIEQIAPDTVRVRVDILETGAPAIVLDRRSAAMQAAFKAYERGWGVPPVYERAGGSVPITFAMMNITDNIALMGFSYKGGRAHGPNENIYVDMFHKGINTSIYFLQALGE